MKKILTSLLCIMMVFCMMPGMAFADGVDAENCTGECKHIAQTNGMHYSTLKEAIEEAATIEDGGTVTLLESITLDADDTIKVESGTSVILELNGETITGTSDEIGANRNMFDVRGTLTVNNGEITLEHTGNNMGWSNSTNVFHVEGGGVLNINNATIENNGGSDMAFCVHLNNWGEVTLNADNVDFKSTYVGIRAFNSGYDMNNITLDNCDVLTGNSCVWVHNYTAADFGNDVTKAAAASERLTFDIDNTNTFARTNGSQSLFRYGFTNAEYYNAEGNRIYGVKDEATLTTAINAAKPGDIVTLQNDIDVTLECVDGKAVTAWITPVGSDITIDLNGFNITGTTEEVSANRNYMLFMAKGDLEFIGEGMISLTHVGTDMGWGASSTVLCTDRGNLVIGENVTVTHNGGTAMAYGVDVYSNANYSPVVDTYGKISSTYIAVRLANHWEVASNPISETLNVYGGTIEGVSRAIWAQHYYGGAIVNVYDGTIKATGTEKYAIDMAGYNQNEEVALREKFGMHVNIGGGTIIGTANEGFNAVRFAYYDVYEEKTTFNITGGKFISNPVDYVTSGNVYKFSNGTYEVAETAPTPTSGYRWPEIATEGVFAEEVIPAPPVDDTPIYIPTVTPSTPSVEEDIVTNETTTTEGTDASGEATGETTTTTTTNANVSASTTITTTETGEAKTETTVTQETADKIVENAVANKADEVVIDATTTTETETSEATETAASEVTIPTTTIETIAAETEASVTIKTDVAEITLDNTAAAAIADQAEGETVSIVAVKTDEVVTEETTETGETKAVTEVHFELKVVCSDGNVIGDFAGGQVTVTVPVPEDMQTEELVCVYIDAQGHYHRVTGVKNVNGTYSFTTGHFSSYAVMTAEAAEAAIEAQKEAVKDVQLKLRSANSKTSKGKKAVKLTVSEVTDTGIDFDGYVIYRSTKKTSGFKKIYTTKTGTYYNTSAKKGVKYYYKAKGFVTIDGEKVYTGWSKKAIRTAK